MALGSECKSEHGRVIAYHVAVIEERRILHFIGVLLQPSIPPDIEVLCAVAKPAARKSPSVLVNGNVMARSFQAVAMYGCSWPS
jgi:hypothetical protein